MEKLNLLPILKDCPKGMELNCTMFYNVKFDCIVEDGDNYPIRCFIETEIGHNAIWFTKYGEYCTGDNPKCVIFPKGKTTWEGFQRPFKDGEIVATYDGRWIGITEGGESCRPVPTYCVIMNDDKFEAYHDEKIKWAFTRLATEGEKEKLFKAIKDNGYRWDAEKKKLEKLVEPNKFDITTLKPFDKVLVRRDNSDEWEIDFFSRYTDDRLFPYECMTNSHRYCIPYEENEHLLGTTTDCNENFKTWKE